MASKCEALLREHSIAEFISLADQLDVDVTSVMNKEDIYSDIVTKLKTELRERHARAEKKAESVEQVEKKLNPRKPIVRMRREPKKQRDQDKYPEIVQEGDKEEKKAPVKPPARKPVKPPARKPPAKICKSRNWTSMNSKSFPAWQKIFKNMQTHGSLCNRECGGGGDCLFHAASYGVTAVRKLRDGEKAIEADYTDARKWAADALIPEDLQETPGSLISQALFSQQNDPEWEKDWWQPNQVAGSGDPLEAMREVIKTEGWYYQGDPVTVDLLTRAMKPEGIGFIILTSGGSFYCPDKEGGEAVDSDYWVLLLNRGGYHWQLAGYDDGSGIREVFKKNELPDDIQVLYSESCRAQSPRSKRRE